MNDRPGPITAEEARNYPPKPPELEVLRDNYQSFTIGARNYAVVTICEYVNQILAHLGNSTTLPVPDQLNVDARMPLYFLRPAIAALNGIISSQELSIDPLPTLEYSLDFQAFTILYNQIITTANAINEAIP